MTFSQRLLKFFAPHLYEYDTNRFIEINQENITHISAAFCLIPLKDTLDRFEEENLARVFISWFYIIRPNPKLFHYIDQEVELLRQFCYYVLHRRSIQTIREKEIVNLACIFFEDQLIEQQFSFVNE